MRRHPSDTLLALGLLALGLAGGCRRAPRAVRYEDFVTDRSRIPAVDDRRLQQECADETRYARPLYPGESLELPVDLAEEPILVLAACNQQPGTAILTTTVTSRDGERLGGSHELTGPGWERWEVDLGPIAGEPATLRLAVTAATGSATGSAAISKAAPSKASLHETAGQQAARGDARNPRPVWISDAYVRQRTAAPAADRPEIAAGRRILLISVDTLREDAVGALAPGGEPIVPDLPTPALDRLAADGEVFSPHYASASWTKPSHAGLLTGYLGATRGDQGFDDPIRPQLPTLAGRLRDAGLLTAGLVHDCVWLDPKFGFARGFDSYRAVKWQASQLTRAAVDWIATHRDRPFFFFLHTFEAHSDFYHLPYEGSDVTRATIGRLFGIDGYGCRAGQCASGFLAALAAGDAEPIPLDPQVLRYLNAAGVASVDASLGRMFDDLAAMGLYDDLLIVLTSDHGEMLLEHGATLHGQPWEPVMRVPLIVKWPHGERAGRRISRRTSALDLAPTLLHAAGADASGLPGSDLRRGGRRPVFADSGWVAVWDGRWKATVGAGQGDTLYDLLADPGEEHDLARERPEVYARLAAEMAARREQSELRARRLAAAGATRGERTRLTPEEEERLRSLGYLR